MKIIPINNNEDINKLADLANHIWHEFFPCILSEEQINFMVEKFQSEKAFKKQLELGYKYYFIDNYGYIGFQIQKDRLFLSKLYLKKEARGKGYSRKAFEFLKNICKKQKLKSIYLTVNKYNEHTIMVYKKFGFELVDSVVTDIGNNFVMDDYIFEYTL